MKDLWALSIMVAAVKFEAQETGRDLNHVECDSWIMARLFGDTKTYSPCQVFADLICEDIKVMYRVLGSQQSLNAYFDDIQTPIVFFIDNVDEYFEPMLESRGLVGADRQASSHRNKSNALWTIAQLGLVGAAHKFHQTNSNVQVYCTIRQEAFRHLGDHTALQTQILGRTVEIRYERADFEEIFKKNIRLMSTDKLHGVPEPDPMKAFFGPHASSLKHRFVDQDETAFDYVLRHTFYRPRDLVTLGKALAALTPKERTEKRIQETVDGRCDTLVTGLFKEMQPFFCLPDRWSLFSHIKQNVLTRDELDMIAKRYFEHVQIEQIVEMDTENECAQPLLVLQKIGMLGWIQTEFQRELTFTQRFVEPREIMMNGPAVLENTEKYYIIHPALDHLILNASGAEFSRGYHSLNIIGNNKPWLPPAASLLVIQGDVKGFSDVIAGEFYESVLRKLHEWSAIACANLNFYEIAAGDSIVMIDGSAPRLINAAAEIIQRFATDPDHRITLRFGGSAGPIEFQDAEKAISGGRQTFRVPKGMALRTSARLEPYAKPGCLIFDTAFKNIGRDHLNSLQVRELGPDDLPQLKYAKEQNDEGLFLVQKNEDDPPYRTKLFELPLL
jgi:hypothetical protein